MDLALSVVYPARGAAELLRSAAKKARISVNVAQLDALFEQHVPNWRLVWTVRIQDFHTAGLGTDQLLTSVPPLSTVEIHLSEVPPRVRLAEGGPAEDVFFWAPPYVQVGANSDPVPILDALEPYLAGMRSLVRILHELKQ